MSRILAAILVPAVLIVQQVYAFNGELAELECPDDCDCHYFRVNWVTDCSDSNLTEIPYDELSPNVYILDLNGNRIKDVGPFSADIKMRRLQVADNLMTEVRKHSFGGLGYLIDADFSGNKITSIDPDAFDDSPGFITLELQDNPLQPVNGPFLSSRSLLYLDISNCGLTRLNPNFFVNVTSLTTIDLSNNPLGSIGTQQFEPLSRLETLKLNNCNLTYIADLAFGSQGSLKTVELAGNSLVTTDWTRVLGHLTRLEYLDLRNSKISFLPEGTFSNSSYLRTLILAENNLQNIDVALMLGQNLNQLDMLDMSYCKLQIKQSEDAFAGSTKLRMLYLSGNNLFESDLLVALSPLVKLEKLSLSNCGLSQLSDTFHKFKSLQELDISHNPLNDVFIKLLEPLETLQYLNMGYSNLSFIDPATFSKMTSMKRLVLSGNDLQALEAGLFGNLTYLESLELNFCGLRRPLNATVFFNNFTYTNLRELHLAGNPLQVSSAGSLLPKQLSRLETLDISNCNLTFLPNDAFRWTQNITNLNLADNRFTTRPNFLDFLQLLPELEVLDLRFNNLTSLTRHEISLNTKIKKLKLIGNPWTCDCSVAELWDWAQLEKGNLRILEGSTTDAEHHTPGKQKRKNLLICNYDAKVPMPMIINKATIGRRPFINPVRTLTSTNRTWAKYVRESGCEPAKLNRTQRSLDTEQDRMSTSPNTWSVAATNAILVYGLLITIVSIGLWFGKKKQAESNLHSMEQKLH